MLDYTRIDTQAVCWNIYSCESPSLGMDKYFMK